MSWRQGRRSECRVGRRGHMASTARPAKERVQPACKSRLDGTHLLPKRLDAIPFRSDVFDHDQETARGPALAIE